MPRRLLTLFASLIISSSVLFISGCSIVYKLPIYQGNYIDQKKVDQLEVGMTPAQVQFLIGTPLVDDLASAERWDYVAYYKSPRGVESKRVLTVWFDNRVVSKIDGKENPFAPPSVEDAPAESNKGNPEERVAPPSRPISEQKQRAPGEDI